jgi:hypothetical protein
LPGEPDYLRAFELMDFNQAVFLEECYNIGTATAGAFSYKDLKEMNFEDYHTLIKVYNHKNSESPGVPNG